MDKAVASGPTRGPAGQPTRVARPPPEKLLTQQAIAAQKRNCKPTTLEGIVANLLDLSATDRLVTCRLVTWLEPNQRAALGLLPPPAAGLIRFSGRQDVLENAPPPAEG